MTARLWRAAMSGEANAEMAGMAVTTGSAAVGGIEPAELSAGGTLLRVWSAHWKAGPDRTVLVSGSDPATGLSNQALDERTARAAALLAQRGVEAGDRVLWSGAPSLGSIVSLLGALRLGAVVVPLNPSSTASELSFVVGDVRPVAAVMEHPDHRDRMAAAHPAVRLLHPADLGSAVGPLSGPTLDGASPDDDALIVYTSGTTGQPKGAVHTHRSLLAGAQALRSAWGWQPDDRLILALPLFHVHGLCAGLFGTLAAGASAVVFERFAVPSVLAAVPQSSMFFGVPTMYHRLAESGRATELAALRLCVSGSAPLAAELWSRLNTEHHVAVLERYGMSETLLTLSNPLAGERRPGSVGLPLPGVTATVAEADEHGVGELMVRGPSLCRGYWERPEATVARADGWFVTGDLASVGRDGYFSIAGRRTELIITGGHNVYPAEVEAVLGRHASVAEIAVVGVASAEWGESVMAFVVGAEGDPDLDALAQLAQQELAPFKQPREYRVVDALPRNAMGKVIRRDLAGSQRGVGT
jgi:malonyl-CoA/methylmalonyl-CoA synthetase